MVVSTNDRGIDVAIRRGGLCDLGADAGGVADPRLALGCLVNATQA